MGLCLSIRASGSETVAAELLHEQEVLDLGAVEWPAVEGIDVTQKAQADLFQQMDRAPALKADCAELFLDLNRKHTDVERDGGEQRVDEFFVLGAELISLTEAQAGHALAVAFPE